MSKQKNLPSWLLWSHHKGDPNVIHIHSHVEMADSHILPQLAHLECLFPFLGSLCPASLLSRIPIFKIPSLGVLPSNSPSWLCCFSQQPLFCTHLGFEPSWDSMFFNYLEDSFFPPNLKVSSKKPRVHLPLHLCHWPWQSRGHSLLRDPPPLSPPHCLASYFFYETISWGRWPALHLPPPPWLLIDLLSSHSHCGVKKDHVIYVVSASEMLE